MKKTILSMVLLVLTVPPPTYGQAPSLTDDPRVKSALTLLETWVQAEQEYEQIPGISMGIVYDQDLIWSRGFGHSDLEGKIPATPETIYSICSISKLFTSVSMMQLRDEGKLHLDDAVADHLSWFDIRQSYSDAPKITVGGILTHSSGLPRESDYPYWRTRNFPTHQEIVTKLSEQETLYPADTYFQYSNLGLTLAGEIVAEVSGLPYSEYVKTRIIEPLGLKNTTSEIPNHLLGGQLATGYGPLTRSGTRKQVPQYEVRGVAPAAGFASTVEDLARFASWQFRVLHHGSDDVLQANTLKEMHRVHWLDSDWENHRGLGFAVWRNRDTTFVGHGGSCPGYRTHLALQTTDRVAVVFMTNALGVSPASYTDRAYQIVAPAIKATVDEPDEAESTDPTFDRFMGMYRTDLGRETTVFAWDGKLSMLSLPTENPLDAMLKLEHIGGNSFKRIRDDGGLGEEILFVVGESGEIESFRRNSNYYPKVN